MRPSLVRFAFVSCSLFAFGCAQPGTEGATGTGGSTTSGAGGTSTSGAGGSSSTGTGGSSSTGTGGSATSCTANPSQLVNSAAWNCDASDPIAIQGAIYGYSDGSSCASPQPTNICTTGSCCISGTTVVDATSAKWGCGIGMELNDAGGTATKMAYTGPVQCFNITLTGSSGGNEVRIGFTQKADN